jgi:hypothetical protein
MLRILGGLVFYERDSTPGQRAVMRRNLREETAK